MNPLTEKSEHRIFRISSAKARALHGRFLNDHAFETLTQESAYWIGFLAADGSICGVNQVSVELSERDADHLIKLRSFLGSNQPLYRNRGCAKLSFSSQQIVKTLGRYGICRRKTHSVACPPELLMDRDYWRGVIDGDGHVCLRLEKLPPQSKESHGYTPRLHLVGNEQMVSQFLDYCRSRIPRFKNRLSKHASIFACSLGGRTAAQIVNDLYRNSVVALERKAMSAAQIAVFSEMKWGIVP